MDNGTSKLDYQVIFCAKNYQPKYNGKITHKRSIFFALSLQCAGYFHDGVGCTLCKGHTVKTSAGNHACDTTCDGVRTVHNKDHTACGEFLREVE